MPRSAATRGNGQTLRRTSLNAEFEAWARRAQRDYAAALIKAAAEPPELPRERPNMQLKLEIYRYYRNLRERGLLPQLERYVTERDGPHFAGSRGGGVPWTVRLFERSSNYVLQANSRSRLYAELEFADAHDVKPSLDDRRRDKLPSFGC